MLKSRSADPLDMLTGKPGETLGETLYRTLLDMIMYEEFDTSRLLPGELASRFGVSPTPVREALARIAQEGYIETIPRRGFHVRQPAIQHVVDTWQVRLGLELTAGELAIARLRIGQLSTAEIDGLIPLQQQISVDKRPRAHRRHTELNAEFHRRLIALSGNRMLVAIYDSVQWHVFRAWIRRGSHGWTDRLPAEAREHEAILEALKSADFDAYSRATRAHLERSLADALSELRDVAECAARSPNSHTR